MALFDHIKVKRRYTRSVNLERDLDVADSVNGYIITPKSEGLINQFLESISTPNSVRAWTITGAYGTGKSAFAHFLLSLCSSKDDEIRHNAFKILKSSNISSSKVARSVPERGFIKAVVTAQREPIANTILRGLKFGVEKYYANARGAKGQLRSSLNSLFDKAQSGKHIKSEVVLQLIHDLSKSAKIGMLIVIDELGKNLEYVSQAQSTDDLYLLQQIAELPTGSDHPNIFTIGLLHQSFYEYSSGLASAQRNEWMKIQGRFEDHAFTESPARLVHLIADAIDQAALDVKQKRELATWAKQWKAALMEMELGRMKIDDIAHIYPFHPLCAIALPILCSKFSQNDRTLFAFLASDEPHSFKSFLKTVDFSGDMPSLKIHQLYDFFIESSTIAISSRSHNQRWIEVQNRISELGNLDIDSISALKTIGTLNLISSLGIMKAAPRTVALSLCNDPSNGDDLARWDGVIERLTTRGFIKHISSVDGLRIWEGTDFDLEKVLVEETQKVELNIASVLNDVAPLKPAIARRHSYVTGTVRYFEKYYVEAVPTQLSCKNSDSDGLILYVTSKGATCNDVPAMTEDNKPVIVFCASDSKALKHSANEYAALKNIKNSRKELLSDSVARMEVNHRLFVAEESLKWQIEQVFDVTKATCFVLGKRDKFIDVGNFNAHLSDLCDQTYPYGPVLWNELINKRELTSQGAKARRELLEAMLNKADVERLALIGHGPECSMYESLLLATGVHALHDGRWSLGAPRRDSGVHHVWHAVEEFCTAHSETPQSLDKLYELLQKPPYGMKQGAIPVILLGVFIHHNDFLSIYYDGSYIPALGAEHFELLTKKPELFAVKYLEVTGLRVKLFEELGEVVSASKIKDDKRVRNVTLLSIINPLVKFAQRLPRYTANTDNLSQEAKAVRSALVNAKDPEELLFRTLPQACGYSFIDSQSPYDDSIVKAFRKKLVLALQELQTAYDNLLARNKKLVCDAFSLRKGPSELREYLYAITSRVHSHTAIVELNLKRFIQASMNKDSEDRAWLEAVLMVIADKPVDSWSDKDELSFEIRLGEIVKRFKSIEAIIELAPDINTGFEARKVTITHQDGKEFSEVLWLDSNEKDKISATVRELKQKYFSDNDKMNKALLTSIIEEVLSPEEGQKEEKSKKYGSQER